MRLLFLDDDQTRIDQFYEWTRGHDLTVVMNAEDAIFVLSRDEPFDLIFLDHDLEDMHYTPQGYQERPETTGDAVAQWLVANPEKRPKRAIVHSWNPDGAQRMGARLHECGVRVLKCPFGPKLKECFPQIRDSRAALSKRGERAESKGGE